MKSSRFVGVPVLLTLLLVLGAGLISPPRADAQDVQVTSADPPSAEQGTINLDVTIKGKGFKNGAQAKWFVTGTTNPGGVQVNSTTFINPTELRANITIADDAVISTFDVVVANSNGRSGRGTELFSVVEKGSGGSSLTLVRASFRNAAFPADRVQSDGKRPCGYDYVDKDDFGCSAEAAEKGASKIISGVDYFLRTIRSCCGDEVMNPARWLVLDFSVPADNQQESPCPALDTRIRTYDGLPGTRHPDAVSPEDPDPCVDLVEVRLFASEAFHSQAAFTALWLHVDAPDRDELKGGKSKGNPRVIWNAKFQLKWVNPLSRQTVGNTVVLTTMPGLDQVELWDTYDSSGNPTRLLGTYRMPLQLTLERVP